MADFPLQGLTVALVVAVLFFDILMLGASLFIQWLKEDEALSEASSSPWAPAARIAG